MQKFLRDGKKEKFEEQQQEQQQQGDNKSLNDNDIGDGFVVEQPQVASGSIPVIDMQNIMPANSKEQIKTEAKAASIKTEIKTAECATKMEDTKKQGNKFNIFPVYHNYSFNL